MNRSLKRLLADVAVETARKDLGVDQVYGLLDDRTPAAMLPDGMAWYVEVVTDRLVKKTTHGYEVQLTSDGEIRAYGIGPGTTFHVPLPPVKPQEEEI